MWTIEVIVMLSMIGLNGLFSGYEMALAAVSLAQLRVLDQKNRPGARAALDMKKNMAGSLAVIQLGITLFGAIAAATGGSGAEEYSFAATGELGIGTVRGPNNLHRTGGVTFDHGFDRLRGIDPQGLRSPQPGMAMPEVVGRDAGLCRFCAPRSGPARIDGYGHRQLGPAAMATPGGRRDIRRTKRVARTGRRGAIGTGLASDRRPRRIHHPQRRRPGTESRSRDHAVLRVYQHAQCRRLPGRLSDRRAFVPAYPFSRYRKTRRSPVGHRLCELQGHRRPDAAVAQTGLAAGHSPPDARFLRRHFGLRGPGKDDARAHPHRPDPRREREPSWA